ncbi:cryptococcal mannosyltransferase 1-domain-containing protein, partial [Mycena vulgaris]
MQNGWRNMSYASLRPGAAKPVAWLLAASKQPLIRRILSPFLWFISLVFSLALPTAFLTLPIYLFWLSYNYCYHYWLFYFPDGLFAPAWPEPRTRLLLLSWAMDWVTGRTLRGGDYEAAIPMEDVHPNGATHRKSRVARSHPSFLGRHYLGIVFFFVFMAMALSGVYMYETYELPGDHLYRPDIDTALRTPRESGYHDGTKVFIGVMFSNNIAILPYWIKEFTKENVFISVVESNSWDGTAEMLDEWKTTLDGMGVAHQTIKRPAEMPGNVRIGFLSAVRNLVMAPLVKNSGLIFSNDVLIETESVVDLLKTKDGEWDMVCGLDLARWGYAGLEAVMADQPAPVFACWNGIVAFHADPLLPIPLHAPGHLSTSPLTQPLPATSLAYPQPADLTPALTPPIAFRSSGPNEPCYSSESFNLPYDLRRQFDMQRIFLNQRVINSYEWKYYVWYKWVTRHWLVVWWMKNVEMGSGMQFAKMVIGDAKRVWTWDGGECHPINDR